MAIPLNIAGDVRTELIAQGLGSSSSTGSWPVFEGFLPQQNDQCIVVTQFPGGLSNPKWLYEELNVQILVRGNPHDYSSAERKIQNIKDGLLGLAAKTISGTDYTGFWESPPATGFLKYDDNNRPHFISNWRIGREPNNSSTQSNRTSL